MSLFSQFPVGAVIGTCLTLASATPASYAGSQTESKAICSGEASYTQRRLATEDVDEICSLYAGKVMLVVNTASRCAYTDQYDGLEKLYAQYRDRGLVVIGFPSNDFANQEPGTEKTIQSFCRLTYGVDFPMYAKTTVKGDQVHPFYKALAEASGSAPRWNFHKYLLDRKGNLADSFGSSTDPQSDALIAAIERLL